MKAVIIVPHKQTILSCEMPEDETDRYALICKFLGTKSVTIVPYQKHCMYISNVHYAGIPIGNDVWGFILDRGKGQKIVGSAVIMGLGEHGEDIPCTIGIKELAEEVAIGQFVSRPEDEPYIGGPEDDIIPLS